MSFVRCLALCLLAGTAVAEERVLEYTFLTAGEKSGSMTTTVVDDTDYSITFEFNDRGRGPQTTSRFVLNDAGIPELVEVEGHNYRKGTVNEKYSTGDGNAEWSSTLEQGEAEFTGEEFYLSFDGPPEELAILAKAILATSGGSVPLLPTGTATIEKLADATLEQDGESKSISLYGISGIDSSPTHVWLDDNGDFFGINFGWFGIVRRGWESHLPVLKDGQTEATDAFFEALASNTTIALDDMLVIQGARIFDSHSGSLTEPSTVFVWDGKISAIFDGIESAPDSATVIDARGKTLMPSLWDMHAHVQVGSYANYLAAGVMNVRDMANDPENVHKLKKDVREQRIAGPDVYALGFVDKRGEYSAPTGNLADTLEDGFALIDMYAKEGFHGLKLYSSIEPEWVEPLTAHAHEHDMVVMGHVPAYMNAQQAIDAGYDEITHINMILLNFLGGEELDTRTPNRFIVPGEKAGALDLDSDEVEAFLATMKEKGIAHDPTLTIFLNMFENKPGEVVSTVAEIADHLPANIRRGSISSTGYNEGKEELYATAGERTRELLVKMHEAGIRILPGTDTALPGFALIRELINYVEAGIPASEALQIATIVPAEHVNQDQRLGSIEVGKDAHIFIVDGNPVENIRDLYRVEEVIKGRQMYHAADLLSAQGFKPFTESTTAR